MNEKHVGSDFNDFLREEGLLEEVEAVAAKRVLAYTEQRSPEGAGAGEVRHRAADGGQRRGGPDL
ncbi:MAG TPA: hypothetical protein VLF66_12475 [Thermoanaerobaculia bacterium]|nr:hypothetical protein [Thermoanaerobaculia bacterium]